MGLAMSDWVDNYCSNLYFVLQNQSNCMSATAHHFVFLFHCPLMHTAGPTRSVVPSSGCSAEGTWEWILPSGVPSCHDTKRVESAAFHIGELNEIAFTVYSCN